MLISAVVPAYNEAKTIRATLKALQNIDGIQEIIVVDDGSADNTADIAQAMGVVVVRLVENCGKGRALQVGCAISKGDILLLLDADLGESAGLAGALLEPILKKETDATVAVLPLEGVGGFGLVQGLSRWAIRRSGGKALAQPLSGQRALKKEVWKELGGFDGGFGVETVMSMGIHRLGHTLMEVPVSMQHRRTTRNWPGIIHRGRQFSHVLWAVVKHWRWL
ncbi:MAG: glycosyltransferase [Firmicutes bacterium]|nr:glycosyltransferase [Bacillota bacterium]